MQTTHTETQRDADSTRLWLWLGLGDTRLSVFRLWDCPHFIWH